MKWYFILLALLISISGCTKKEFKSNFHNVKTGAKKDWNSARHKVAQKTEEYKNH